MIESKLPPTIFNTDYATTKALIESKLQGALPTLEAPTGFAGVADSDTEITLSWNAVANATGYILSRAGTPIYTGPLLTFQDTGLTASTLYNYTVVATAPGYNNSPPAATSATTNEEPSATLPAGSLVAYKFDAVLPLDLSGNGVNMAASGGSWANPTNDGIRSTYLRASNNKTTLGTTQTIAASTPFTFAFRMQLNDLSQAAAGSFEYKYLYTSETNYSSFSILHATNPGKMMVRLQSGTSDTTSVDISNFTIDTDINVILKRDASNICTIQFNDATPIILFGGSPNTAAFNLDDIGNEQTNLNRGVDHKWHSLALYDSDITGSTLATLKLWLES